MQGKFDLFFGYFSPEVCQEICETFCGKQNGISSAINTFVKTNLGILEQGNYSD